MSKETFLTLPQVAKKVGLHRTTLLRMEQRGVIPKARWAQKPFRARVYSEADVKVIEKALQEYFDGQGGGGTLKLDPEELSNPENRR